ncbi:MAG: response regulator transcription factor [Actinobacteria bacterium]|nr:response regulator transcription factor [Actinomycetota bacterium]
MIVVVEQDALARASLCQNLYRDGFDALPAATAEEALSYFQTARPEVVVVDLGLPDAAGFELIRRLRDPDILDGRIDPDLAILTIRPGDEPARRFRPYLGADGSLVRPFGYPDLRRSLEVLGRRTAHDWSLPIMVGDLRIDPARGRTVTVRDRRVDLSKTEFFLLRTLASDPTRPFTREQLMSDVLGRAPDAAGRAIDQHAGHLRHKLDPDEGRYVISCHGVGYRLVRG